MINCLIKSLEIDNVYTVNSFIYTLRKLPILNDLFTEDIYSSKILKNIVSIIITIFFIVRAIFLKFFYFFIILLVCYEIFPNTLVKSYFHIFFFLTIIGMFINNKLLNTNKKKYFSIILFNMDATLYFKSNVFWNQLSNLILNGTCILFFGYMLRSPIFYSIILILLTFFIRPIGEALNIIFYKRYKYIWYSNTKLYIIVLALLLMLTSLPLVNIFIPLKAIVGITIISIVLGVLSLIYLLKIDDYKLIYKKLSSKVNIMNQKYEKDYLKQAMVEVKDKDKIIDNKKIKGKKGYDLFNAIFFERHKQILIRSAKKFSLILIGIYIVVGYFMLNDQSFSVEVSNVLHNKLGWFVIIMYFVNRGAIITQAMFFNCDHAMLNYNFYRKPKTLLGLFKKRLLTISKVNLLPALVVGVGNAILLIISNNYNMLIITSTFLFIIFLSIFFSVHYLVIYYLMQPFNKDLEVKKISYSFVTLITYIVCFNMTDIVMNSVTFSIFGLLFTIIYILLALYLVVKLAPKTFKLN